MIEGAPGKPTGSFPLTNCMRGRRGGGLASDLFWNSLISMAVRLGGMAIAFLSHVLLSRLLGAADYGSYVIALGWAMLLAIVTRLGLDNTALRFATAYREERRLGDLRGLMSFSLGAMAAISLLFLVILLLGKWAGYERLSGIPTMMLFGVAGLAYGAAVLGWYSALIRTAHRIVASQVFEQVVRPASFLAAIGIALLLGVRIAATGAMLLTLLSTLAALLLIVSQTRKSFGSVRQHAALFGERQQWLSMGWVLVIMALFQESLNQIEVIFFGLLTDASAAAHFSAAARLSSLVPFGLTAVVTISGPLIASAFRQGNMPRLSRISHLNARFSLGFAIALAIVLTLAGRPLLRMFGPSFEVAYPALLILLAGAIVNAFTGSVGYLLIMTGKHLAAMVIIGFTLLLSATLNLLLIPRLGIVGGAIASASGVAFWNLAMLVYVRINLGIDASAIGVKARIIG